MLRNITAALFGALAGTSAFVGVGMIAITIMFRNI